MKSEIVSQYRASLKMLMDAIRRCPEDLWVNEEYMNAYWRIAYHALHYTDLYLAQNPGKFNPWRKYIKNYHMLGKKAYDGTPIETTEIYSKKDLLDYGVMISENCENAVSALPMEEKSGFEWLPMNRLELHFYNIRHLQHHTGQLVERLHLEGITEIPWAKSG
jgi:hypothetical protein